MALTLNLPDELAARLTAEAAGQRVSVEELVIQLVAAGLPVDDDPLENFISSGASGRNDLGRRHRQVRAGTAEGLVTKRPVTLATGAPFAATGTPGVARSSGRGTGDLPRRAPFSRSLTDIDGMQRTSLPSMAQNEPPHTIDIRY